MVRTFLLTIMMATLALSNSHSARGDDRTKDEHRLQNAGQVMTEITRVPDKIPQKLLDKRIA